MAGQGYRPVYWEKYGLTPPVQFPVSDWVNAYPALVDSLRSDIKRLKGEEYQGEQRGKVIQQIEDAEREWELLARQHVGSQADKYGSRPVVPPKKKFIGVVNETLLENLGKK